MRSSTALLQDPTHLFLDYPASEPLRPAIFRLYKLNAPTKIKSTVVNSAVLQYNIVLWDLGGF